MHEQLTAYLRPASGRLADRGGTYLRVQPCYHGVLRLQVILTVLMLLDDLFVDAVPKAGRL